jgi:hypothetical protein
MAKAEHVDKLRRLLTRRPERAATLLDELKISQPTLSRLWAGIGDGVALGAGRARQYALRRHVPDVRSPMPLFAVSEKGEVAPIGHLDTLHGGYYAFTPASAAAVQLYQGLPYFLRDLRPQGFLGRMEPAKHADLDLPIDILRWTDEQVLTYISRRSEHAPGDVIVGNESYARYLADAATAAASVVRDGERAARYPAMAAASMLGEPAGSSAGGEQPKFTAVVRRDGGVDGGPVEHVIVKFSPQTDTPGGRRWGDLLVCEHLALEVLAAHQIAAATTSILEARGRVFLEVVRFDRVGLHGRLPMATLAAFDGDPGMLDQGWTAVAHELGRRGELAAADIDTMEMLDLYGSLIGNTDKHHGNIALRWAFGRRHTLLDAYDMLPMLYRPNAHGEVIAREWTPNLGARLELKHLPLCYRMADDFWQRVLDDPRVSPTFKQAVAERHTRTLRALGAASRAAGQP